MTDIGSMTTEEALSHYGVKGMRWGTRRGNKPSSTKSTKAKTAKPTTADIKAARTRHNERIIELHKKAREGDKSKNRAEAVKRAAEVRDLSEKIRKSPDFDKAFTLTKGEKAASWMVLGPVGRLSAGANMNTQKNVAQLIVDEGANYAPDDFKLRF